MTEQLGRRVGFAVRRVPGRAGVRGWRGLAAAMTRLVAAGGAPVLADGYVGGNAARLALGGLLVSRSGRRPGRLGVGDFVLVEDFDPELWKARFIGAVGTKPTSDTPLYWAALIEAPRAFRWRARPRAAIHGHLFAQGAPGVPVSNVATTASSPEDRRALMDLLRRHPYPAHRVWIRRAHGFFALGTTPADAFRSAARLWEAP